MKKVVRMLGLCALVALAFTACKKDDTQKVTFTANVAQTTCDARTHAEYGTYLVWDDGDVIRIFNQAGDDMSFPGHGSVGLPGVAEFYATTAEEIEFVKDLEDADLPYTAFFPNATIDENDRVNLVIPAEQTYVEKRSFASNIYPMVGHNNGTTRFDFVSDAGFLNVLFYTVEPDEVLYVDEIVLTANDETDYLSGTMIYDKDGSNYEFVGEGNQVVLTTGAPVDIIHSMSRDFTFVLPKEALWSGFTVQVKNEGVVLETYEAQPRPTNVIRPQNYTVMIDMPLPMPPAPTE
jgi:hypothetical protein